MTEASAGHAAAGPTATSGLRRALADLPAADRVGLVTAMTLVLLLLFSGGGWYVQAPVAVLGAAGLLLPALRRSSWFWLGLGALLFSGFLYEWSIVDNHQYLYVYWCLALGLALRTAEPGAQLAVSARWLVALCFLSATIWKALSPDFLDGSFFHHALLVDSRLQWAAERLAGLPADVNAANRLALESLLGYSAEVAPIELRSSPRVAALARILAWATLAIEGLVAFAFAGPARWPLGRLRAPLLLAFALSTYALAPVIGFGWILLILGLAQAPDRGAIPIAYVVAFLVLPLYRVPWRELLASVG